MKFAKFALLCAIAALLFATPRTSHADGWTAGGYFFSRLSSNPLPGQGTPSRNWRYNATSVEANANLNEADITIDSYRIFTWVGSGTPTKLTTPISEQITLAGSSCTGTTEDFSRSTMPTGLTYIHYSTGNFSPPPTMLGETPVLRIHNTLTAQVNGIGDTYVAWTVDL